jgi:hypothetical protein
MASTIRLQHNEALWQWNGASKPPTVIAHNTALPDGEGIDVLDGFQGFAVRREFKRGRMPMDQFVRQDKRFLEPIGFAPADLIRQSELGYFRVRENDPPRKLTLLPQEMAVRAAGLPIISPRDGDRITTWDFEEGGVPSRLVAMCKEGVVLTEDSGRGDARPELAGSAEECLAAGDLRTTNRTREQSIAAGSAGRQAGLFDGGLRPAPMPDAYREYLLGR